MSLDRPAWRYVLRTGPGVFLLVIIAAADVGYALWQAPARRGDFDWAVESLGGNMWVLIPVVLLASTVVTMLQTPPGRELHIPIPLRAEVVHLAVAVMLPVFLHGLVLGVIAAWAVSNGSTFHVDTTWQVVRQLLGLAVAACLGVAAGRASRHPAVALIALAGGALIYITTASTLGMTGGMPMLGQQRTPSGMWPTVVVLCAGAIAACGAVWHGRRSAVAAGLSGLVLVSGGLMFPETLWEFRPDVADVRCDNASTVEYCFYPGYGFTNDPARFALDKFNGAAHRAGVTLPARRVEQIVDGSAPTAHRVGQLELDEDMLSGGEVTAHAAVAALVYPVWCSQVYSESPPNDSAVGDLSGWVLYEAGSMSKKDFETIAPSMSGLSKQAQAQRAQKLSDQLTGCRGL